MQSTSEGYRNKINFLSVIPAPFFAHEDSDADNDKNGDSGSDGDGGSDNESNNDDMRIRMKTQNSKEVGIIVFV